jgi:hypothetical protein
MRRFLSRIVICLSVVALAAPATIVSAAEPDETPRADAMRPQAPAAGASHGLPGSLRGAAERAVAVSAEQRAGQPAPQPGSRGKGARSQMGGGGKGAMIMGLAYTAVGIGASVYMYKMIQDRNNEEQ